MNYKKLWEELKGKVASVQEKSYPDDYKQGWFAAHSSISRLMDALEELNYGEGEE